MGNKPRNRGTSTKSRTRSANRTVAQTRQESPKTPWLRWLLIGGGVAGMILLLVLAFGGLEGKPDPPPGIQTFPGLERNHTEVAVAYAQDPPVGGNHAPIWANCGFYDTPIPSENAIHSLEHGAVWITYQPDLSADQIDKLRNLGGQTEVLVTPYPGLAAPVFASTWGNQLSFTGADDPLLKDFVLTMKNGPSTPEPGGICSGGVGNPS